MASNEKDALSAVSSLHVIGLGQDKSWAGTCNYGCKGWKTYQTLRTRFCLFRRTASNQWKGNIRSRSLVEFWVSGADVVVKARGFHWLVGLRTHSYPESVVIKSRRPEQKLEDFHSDWWSDWEAISFWCKKGVCGRSVLRVLRAASLTTEFHFYPLDSIA